MKNKRGSSTVFLCITLAAVMSITLTLVYASHWRSVDSFADGVISLGGDSLLSEFDYYVQRDYGLFVLNGKDTLLTEKMRNYVSYSLEPLDRVYLTDCSVSGSRFNTINLDNVQNQIIYYMNTVGVADAVSSKHTDSNMIKRTLRHGPTIVSLPSRMLPDNNFINKVKSAASKLKSPEAIFRTGTKKYLFNSYILGHFNSDSTISSPDHFFRNEVEYIISGKYSDESNINRTDLALEALRFPTNLAHIYADPEKWSAVVTAAETITPGLLGTVTQAGIASAWAGAESINDVKLLHEGYRVPVIKDGASWAIDIDGLLKRNTDKLFKPDVNKGRLYDDYLRMLLFMQDDDVKTARILDLIQINMRKNYDSEFLISECSTGIAVNVSVRGKKYTYDRIY